MARGSHAPGHPQPSSRRQQIDACAPACRSSPPLATQVNTAARLEGLTKDYDCVLVDSRRAAEVAGLNLDARLHVAPVKGRSENVEFYALETVPDVVG